MPFKMFDIVASLLIFFTVVVAESKIRTSLSGFLKAEYYGTSNEFNSDQKPINVLSTTGLPLRDASRGQLSIQQSRFAINVDNESRVKLKFEFDLDGEAGNTIGISSSNNGFFRVRLANLLYKVSEQGTITVGKKWDIFSPLNPHSYQMTTAQFWAGNTGSLTDGIDYLHTVANWNFGLELKNAGGNPGTASDVTTAKLSLPIATVRAEFFDDQLYGLCYMYGKLNYERQDVVAPFSSRDAVISGINAYYSGKYESTEIIAEVYTGTNLGGGVVGALATPALTNAVNNRTNDEIGYYVSLKQGWEGGSVFGGYGRGDFTAQHLAPTNSFQGLVSNQIYRLGVDFDLDVKVKLFFEGAHMISSYYESGDFRDFDGTFYNAGLLARF